MVTTTDHIPGYRITETFGLVMTVSEYKMSRPRKAVYTALNDLIEQARRKGANAIIGLRISQATGTEASAIVVYGTAVRAEKEKTSTAAK